jgi:hypothetical protein
MPRDAASRQRAHRERQREGKIVLSVTVDEVALCEALVSGGFLDPVNADNRAEIEAAVERLLDTLCHA